MIIPRDITFHKELLISYYENLGQFVGIKCTQKELEVFFQKKYPSNPDYNTLSRRFATLKFYGFVYFNEDHRLMFNEHFGEYVNCLENNEGVASCFLKILLSSRYKYFTNSGTNFFELVVRLLTNKSILYLDHIDMISYVQHYELVNDFDELVKLITSNRSFRFNDKVEVLETFYKSQNLDSLATRVHDVNYLFSFLAYNGFYINKNSLQSTTYYQKDQTPRKLEDKRLYLSEDLLIYINGFSYESIVDEIEYNSELEDGSYDDPDNDVPKLIDISKRTEMAVVKRYKTDRKLRNNALKKSGYFCEMARLNVIEHKTFSSRVYDGDYAEVHHLIPMHAQENDLFLQNDKLISLDQISNLIVLCPNCHSKLHFGKANDVKLELELLFEERKVALIKTEIILEKEELLGFYNIKS